MITNLHACMQLHRQCMRCQVTATKLTLKSLMTNKFFLLLLKITLQYSRKSIIKKNHIALIFISIKEVILGGEQAVPSFSISSGPSDIRFSPRGRPKRLRTLGVCRPEHHHYSLRIAASLEPASVLTKSAITQIKNNTVFFSIRDHS